MNFLNDRESNLMLSIELQFVKQNLQCLHRTTGKERNLNKNKEQQKVRKRENEGKEVKKWDFDDDAVGARF